MRKHRDALADLAHSGKVDVCKPDTRCLAHIEHHPPPRIDHKRMAIGRAAILMSPGLRRRDDPAGILDLLLHGGN